ncbi:MAG: large-conductance mechanosensitive channel protein MscL [Blastocatellia bacterium]|nr:large-conductance mechanosensitive channel protein MscL [Blastocatellia bacterium]MBL8196446.1 large-conductance mechanosensitive channel protein MscL [Blastocatellia bacterium]MBN8725782.1 large-conductance mechanosensitive channel protein MscL [Acidobacteriota bacterium]
MSIVQEFRDFVNRGNVVDLAVGVVIGGAFGKIVSSLVADVITPVIGVAVGGVNFTALKISLGGKPDAPVTLNYGNFLQSIFDFLIIAFAIFMFVKAINKMQKQKEEAPAAPPAPTKEEVLLTEIRDILKDIKKL